MGASETDRGRHDVRTVDFDRIATSGQANGGIEILGPTRVPHS